MRLGGVKYPNHSTWFEEVLHRALFQMLLLASQILYQTRPNFPSISQLQDSPYRVGSVNPYLSHGRALAWGFHCLWRLFFLLEPWAEFPYCFPGPLGKVLPISLRGYIFWGSRLKQGFSHSLSPLLGPRSWLLSPHGCLNLSPWFMSYLGLLFLRTMTNLAPKLPFPCL